MFRFLYNILKRKFVDFATHTLSMLCILLLTQGCSTFYERALFTILTIDDMATEQKNGLNALRPIFLGNLCCKGGQFRCEKTTFYGMHNEYLTYLRVYDL